MHWEKVGGCTGATGRHWGRQQDTLGGTRGGRTDWEAQGEAAGHRAQHRARDRGPRRRRAALGAAAPGPALIPAGPGGGRAAAGQRPLSLIHI